MSHQAEASALAIPRGGALSEALQRSYRAFPTLGVLFVVLALFVVEDLAADWEAGIGGLHMALEAVSLAVALVGAGVAARQYQWALHRAERLQGDLVRTRADVERWRTEAEALLKRLGLALDEQFDTWTLTDAEREIALLVLKGLSYKEVASQRGTTERTVRHQALAIYRKAGLAGRAEMAAFFLEAMLQPVRKADADERARVSAGDEATAPGRPRLEA